ncbi:hypothetical protein DTO164E3_7147 [Paecilomyces variotii]|uniref:Leucine-rich repeat domain-containing protein n=1 Tax=Byssochlamys spectabilis TaxID=264951 RepID=A0A443HVF1_BYSSP|nr:hypothetical protein C8Q69DRAFT_267794 [Paecilomyces variotii]KAJ9194726.1 hypothetical protein DTO164E3_7147 [Paecilomyces variotii]KAJ9226093.1 hypothetical protein DTO169C6_1732 [Paecilomyces variotii]KAJ9242504.1 hypothetical protein DTO169E5_3213 [Paecilomyces variotii]KAJ9261013.1 hypothetical protein DTO207G8_163 [Paecilomyces variotii]KAJ9266969.1 hypothetical protein DTO195F2_904 [Paecilomyces variotii]
MAAPALVSVLPTEIIILISQSIGSRNDLLNFLYTCRHLYNLLLPQLYREPVAPHDYAGLGEIRRAVSFVQTILRRPHLARSVLHLSLELQETELTWVGPCALNPDLEYDDVLVGEALNTAAISAEDREEWEIDIAGGYCDAWLALLFPALSNLKSLRFVFSAKTRFIPRMLERAINRQRPFTTRDPLSTLNEITALWHVEYYEDDSDGVFHSSYVAFDITQFAKLPALQTLRGHQIAFPPVHGGGADQELSLQPGSSPITKLNISSGMSEDGLLGLIKSCKAIKYLRYTEFTPAAGFRPDCFRRSLPLTKGSLEELWIDYGDYSYPYYERENDWIGSFQDFSRLRKLHIRLPNLFSWSPRTTSHPHIVPMQRLTSLLPPSIETLCITECIGDQGHALVSQLEDLVRNKQTYTPRLSQIEIYIDFLIEEEIHDSIEYACERKQIDFAVRRWWDLNDVTYPSRDDGCILQDTFWFFDY